MLYNEHSAEKLNTRQQTTIIYGTGVFSTHAGKQAPTLILSDMQAGLSKVLEQPPRKMNHQRIPRTWNDEPGGI